MTYDRFVGCIAGAAFASGDTVIVGAWRVSPYGQFVDVMWVHPDRIRTLIAPNPQVGAYVAGLYSFDEVVCADVRGGWDGAAVAVEAGPLRLRLVAGRRDARSWLFGIRPRALRRAPAWITVEDVVARPFVGTIIGGAQGVRAAGTAPGGQREYYGVEDYRPVVDAGLTVDGVDSGGMTDLPASLGIGLSSFPRRPAVVHVATMVQQTGQLR